VEELVIQKGYGKSQVDLTVTEEWDNMRPQVRIVIADAWEGHDIALTNSEAGKLFLWLREYLS
jgi:hypothetical protein